MTALLTLLFSLPSPNSVDSLPLQFYFVDYFLSFLTPFIFVFYFFLYFIYLFCTHFYVAPSPGEHSCRRGCPRHAPRPLCHRLRGNSGPERLEHRLQHPVVWKCQLLGAWTPEGNIYILLRAAKINLILI